MIHKSRLKRIFFVVLLFPAFAFCQSAPRDDRVRGWSSDIDFLISEISKQHYVYRSKALPEALTRQAEQLKHSISQYSDERMLLELQRLISLVGDGHSYVLPANAKGVQSTWLPVRFYLFSDGLYIIDADPGYEKWIGSRVLTLNNVAPDVAMTRVGQMMSQDNTMGTKWIGPFLLRFRGGLEAVGVQLNSTKLSCTLEDSKGRKTEKSFEFVPAPEFHGIPKLIPSRDAQAPPAPLYLADVKSNYWFKELPDQHAVYFQFNQVLNANNNPISVFARSLDDALTAKAPRMLVVDVRNNNGGNSYLLGPLMDVLKKFESNNPKSKIVVITGRNTFSAAQIFITQVNRDTKAIFAGEPSSSRPNFVGEENEIVFPWSGAIGSISNRYHETIPGDQRVWIEPQIKVELSSQDYFSNRDVVLEKVLGLNK